MNKNDAATLPTTAMGDEDLVGMLVKRIDGAKASAADEVREVPTAATTTEPKAAEGEVASESGETPTTGEGEASPKEGEPAADKMDEKLQDSEARAAALQAELDEALKGAPVKIDPSGPLATIWSHEALEARQAEARTMIRFCEDHKDGGELTLPDGTRKEMTPEQVRDLRDKWRGVDDAVRGQERRIEQYNASKERARQKFPRLFDARSGDYAEARAIMRKMPGLLTEPTVWEVLGSLVAGNKVVNARLDQTAHAPTPPAPKARTAPKIPQSGGTNRGPVPAATAEAAKTRAEQEALIIGRVRGANQFW